MLLSQQGASMHLVIWHDGYVGDFVQRVPPQARKHCHSDHYMQMHAQPERRKLLPEFLAIEKKQNGTCYNMD